MKIFFDTNVYFAEALLGEKAEAIIEATGRARWRIHCSEYVLDEIESVLVDRLGFSRRYAWLTRERCRRRSSPANAEMAGHTVASDPADSPILRVALAVGVDLLVTNDRHLLDLNPYHGLRIESMTEYHDRLENEGVLRTH